MEIKDLGAIARHGMKLEDANKGLFLRLWVYPDGLVIKGEIRTFTGTKLQQEQTVDYHMPAEQIKGRMDAIATGLMRESRKTY